MIKVSIIVPVYNVQEYLSRCLESLVNQTLNEIEIIIVNDGSPDNSETIIYDYKNKFPQKIVYLKKENGGLSDARNYGAKYARGEYITYLDSDDYIDLNAYEIMYQYSNQGTKKIIECNFIWAYKDREVEDRILKYDSLKDYILNGRVVAWNKLYKRSWLENTGVIFPKDLLYEDLEFFLKIVPLLESIEDVSIVSESFIYYVQRNDAISYKETARVAHILKIYDNVFNYYRKNKIFEEYKSELEYKYARNLLGSFLKKVILIKDKSLKRMLLNLFWEDLNTNFPEWKKNHYIQNSISRENIYLRVMNGTLYKSLYIVF
ncbi:glycosyltransferase family 2 protein [Carnobacterium mobile]|uniref:glycosyltransferase family 2 protein n=1 Tax=Carnobacterium mobile TaxID=2750 RepID=UPI001868915E|nr:glycosyltransferase family 2 protein [Carnobacterium mobile]